MPFRKAFRIALVAALLPAAAGSAQSLGEIARQNREQKAGQAKATRVYTEDNLPRAGGRLRTVGLGAEAASTAGGARVPEKLAPFVPSPHAVVEKMLELAGVGPEDVVYDLGSGDGRILFAAAQKFGARAVGVELDEGLCRQTLERIHELKLEDRVNVIQGDLLDEDLTPATVVTLYLLTSSNEKVRPNLEKYLRKGARVVSHDFPIAGWKPEKMEPIEGVPGRRSAIYLYRR